MNFFDPPPPPPPREPQRRSTPPWFGPPANVLPGAATFAALLVNTGDVALAVTGGLATPAGLAFTVHVRRRQPRGHRSLSPFYEREIWDEDGQVRAEVLRFGVEFADGRRAQTLSGHRGHGDDDPPGPSLTTRGGGGTDQVWDGKLWLWPLPPPGPLTFVCAWPSEGIPETHAEIDATPIVAAAGRAVVLWPDDLP